MASVLKLGVLVFAILGLSCCTIVAHVPPSPAPSGTPDCKAACDQLRHLGCAAAKPTSEGVECESWCSAASEAVGYPAGCVADASTCAEAEACQ
ncbi:MAG: hypothetical protein HOV80_17630 [Polyangiaceae bacterium]|nr:hypothetical protein [Polyangiaceae bacterium]